MNLLLLYPEDMIDTSTACISGRQLAHMHDTLNVKVGDILSVGLLGGRMGKAEIFALSSDRADLKVSWETEPPAPLPVKLVIALPRPKMLKRIIQTATTMGVKELYFINSWKVEKSFWQSPWLSEEKLHENCVLGLEQGKDTILPDIHIKKLFKPFVEDELPTISKKTRKLLAHPGVDESCPVHIQDHTTLVIGPEGGFTPYEVSKLVDCGFEPVHLGDRILRVETAVPVLLARLFP